MIHILLVFSYLDELELVSGSFFMVIDLRIPIWPFHCSSKVPTCSNCFHYLGTLELIPSFLMLYKEGHCRHCHTTFSFFISFQPKL